MDTMVHGVKGSGKTYYAVYHISKLKDKSKVLHNIKGLSLGTNIHDLAKKWNLQPIDFFRDSLHDEDNDRYDQRFKDLHGYLFVVDECQKLFPKKFNNQDVDQFFQMSRHYDIDTFLLTQDEKLVAPSIKVHPELFLRAVSDTANPLPGFFLYRKLVGWEQVGLPIKIRKKQAIFDLYKSANTKSGGKESRKKSRPMIILAGCALLCAVSAFGYFKYYTSHRSELRGNTPSSLVSGKVGKLKSNKKISRYQNDSDNQSGRKASSSAYQYPQSFSDEVGGLFFPVSTISDKNGRYVIFLDQVFPINMFPFRIVNTPFGKNALVPSEVYQYAKARLDQSKILANNDPNSAYYWQETNQASLQTVNNQ